MKKARIKKIEEKKEVLIEEEYSLKRMLKIIAIILIIFVLFYFVTTIVIKTNTSEEKSNVVIDSSKITIGQLLTREYDEYYVMAFKESLYDSSYIKTNYTQIYNNYIKKYKQGEKSLPFYYIDLDDGLNKKYFSNELNITDDISKLKLNDEVLFKIKNNKIEKAYVGKDEIIDKLSRL